MRLTHVKSNHRLILRPPLTITVSPHVEVVEIEEALKSGPEKPEE
jgi:hypothetical protein